MKRMPGQGCPRRSLWAGSLCVAACATALLGCATWRPGGATKVAETPEATSGVRQVSFEENEPPGAEVDPVTVEKKSWWETIGVERSVRESIGKVEQDKARAKRLYAEAEALYDQGMKAPVDKRDASLHKAAKSFALAGKYYTESDLEENSLMYAAECYYFLDEYPDAVEMYGKLIKKYPNTKYLDQVGNRRFKLARYWVERYNENPDAALTPNFTDEQRPLFDRFGNAIKLYDMIRLDDPTGKLADDATLAAANANFKLGKYEAADRFYTDLRQNFPSSEHQFIAHYLGMFCKLKMYQGPSYDGQSLDEAGKLADRMERQFPDRVVEHREAIDAAKKEIRAKQAERLWHLATFFEGRQQYGGARFYYYQVIQEFPNSNMADAARDRMKEIADRPDHPVQHAKWLVDLVDYDEDKDMPKIAPEDTTPKTANVQAP
ncbi:outer membrane protein assembly factor BamD [Blastopirellula sp. JC732]|uniref:Outer membrane protein assembly factor BamD n=1 Tax=Blastopirellula sediminis TaxID=2894196 RepID=A0A9X1MJY4_9BACT|nr:outer membrane protein assembly factor BamD [Blastopirellula sediminis]MCC9604334.1 outer membrane protein assembly factor BamD [Blastopirellula sediminis]MCC9626854.1 outer membrane protein assembly factor BamD [Blastopirellula sediminis]